MVKKILKWTGIILLVLIIGLFITVASRQHLTFDAPYPEVKATNDSAIILRGKELVFGAAHCTDCHSPEADPKDLANGIDVPLTGGFGFEMPIGIIYSKNLTPDMETGIGRMTDAEIGRVLRYGVRKDGTALIDFMPFHNTSDEDLSAIISYLRAQKPVHKAIPPNKRNILGNVVMAFLIKPVGPSGEVFKTVQRDSTIEYGKYLANDVANCAGCHTERNMMTGGYIGERFSGGMEVTDEKDPDKILFYTPNLTPDPGTGRMANWTQENFIQRFRQGKLIKESIMPWAPFSKMSDNDLKAIYKYLKSLKPVKKEIKPIKS